MHRPRYFCRWDPSCLARELERACRSLAGRWCGAQVDSDDHPSAISFECTRIVRESKDAPPRGTHGCGLLVRLAGRSAEIDFGQLAALDTTQ